jgi:hypothetical protein
MSGENCQISLVTIKKNGEEILKMYPFSSIFSQNMAAHWYAIMC